MPPLRLKFASLCLLLSSLLLCGQSSWSQDFTVVMLPDTQNEATSFPQVMDSETQWVVDNQQALNIQVVLGVGDIVNDGAQTAQQQNADAAVRLLDNAGIPYLLAIGNHDYDNAAPRPAAWWIQPVVWAGAIRRQGFL